MHGANMKIIADRKWDGPFLQNVGLLI